MRLYYIKRSVKLSCCKPFHLWEFMAGRQVSVRQALEPPIRTP
ncbi:MAG: hypothetical protein WC568_04735 [Candidatus Methanoperedens sp.]